MTGNGIEWLVDARGCAPDVLRDPAALQRVFGELVADLDLRVIGAPLWHVFPGAAGVTGVCMLAESHLAIHTFPEHASLCLNLFCCRERPEWDFQERLRALVGARDVEVRRVERHYTDSPAIQRT